MHRWNRLYFVPKPVLLGFKPAHQPSIHQASKLASHQQCAGTRAVQRAKAFFLAAQSVNGSRLWQSKPRNGKAQRAPQGDCSEMLRKGEMASFQRLPQNACSRLWRICTWFEKDQRTRRFVPGAPPLAQTAAQCSSSCREPGRGSRCFESINQPTTGQTYKCGPMTCQRLLGAATGFLRERLALAGAGHGLRAIVK